MKTETKTAILERKPDLEIIPGPFDGHNLALEIVRAANLSVERERSFGRQAALELGMVSVIVFVLWATISLFLAVTVGALS